MKLRFRYPKLGLGTLVQASLASSGSLHIMGIGFEIVVFETFNRVAFLVHIFQLFEWRMSNDNDKKER